jgi:hypothetical protein
VKLLKAVLESDPGALVRMLHLFQTRSIVPVRVEARRLGAEFLEVEIVLDAASIPPETLHTLVAKARELPIVVVATLCD